MSDYVQTDEQTGAWIFNWTVSVSIAGLSRLLVATLQFGGQELSSATGHLLVGPKTWNSLPSNTRNSPSVNSFKIQICIEDIPVYCLVLMIDFYNCCIFNFLCVYQYLVPFRLSVYGALESVFRVMAP